MKVLNEWFINAPWGKIALISWGTPNGPPVLLVHGREDSAATFIPLLKLLPDTNYYVGVDLPGHGRSDPLPFGIMLARMHFVGTINIVLRHLKWMEFVYIGHSMGTEQGLFFNAAYPGRVIKFVLLDPQPSFQRLHVHDPVEYMKSFYQKYYDDLPKFAERRLYSKRQILESVKRARGLTDEQAELVLSRNLTRVGDDLYELSWDRRLRLPAPQNYPTEFYYKVWSKHSPPTLVISAKKEGLYYDKGKDQAAKLISYMQKNLKNFFVLHVEGGHDVHFTNPERFVNELCAFLDKKFDTKSKLYTMKAAMRLAEKEVTIQAPWGKIRGLSWGSKGNPGVLLCHGKLDVCSGFRPLVRLLPECFHYFAVDLPGNGRSQDKVLVHRSDHFPPGSLQTAMDFVPTIRLVKDHLKWDRFMFVGHSMGVILGKFFNMAYPGHIARMVELDPIPAYDNYNPDPDAMKDWYHHFYHTYYVDWFAKLNKGGEAPKYTYEKALQMMMKNRDLHKEAAECILERAITPAGDGLYRFSHDQRMKRVTRLPFSGDTLRAIYTSTHVPIFCVLAEKSLNSRTYAGVPFIKDEKLWPHGNYSFKIVEGGHDVHISHPERMSAEISRFLLNGSGAKL